jgi:hypothetical protein
MNLLKGNLADLRTDQCWFIIGGQESIVIVLPNTNITMICDYLEKVSGKSPSAKYTVVAVIAIATVAATP